MFIVVRQNFDSNVVFRTGPVSTTFRALATIVLNCVGARVIGAREEFLDASSTVHVARNLYIDVGANRGDTLRMFYNPIMDAAAVGILNNPHPFQFHYDPSEFRVVAFEAMKEVHSASLESLQKQYDFEVMWFAVSDRDNGTLRIFRDEQSSVDGEWGAGILPLFSNNFVDVPTVDLSSWLSRNCELRDEVIAKMNVEGSEFQVLDKMILDGSMCLLDKAHVYFHPSFFPEQEEILRDRIVHVYKPAFDACGIEYAIWIH